MSERQPTDAEWQLVAGVMDLKLVDAEHNTGCKGCDSWSWMYCNGSLVRCDTRETFDPLYSYNDLARLVDALPPEYEIVRTRPRPGSYRTTADRNSKRVAHVISASTDIDATFWTCVGVLVDQEKRDADTDG